MNAYRDQYAKLFKNGRNVVLIAISADPDTALASWARDSEFPFLFASDTGTVVARRYSLPRAIERGGTLVSEPGITNRNLFVVGPDGRIAYRAIPFREVDPTAYTELGAAIDKLVPADTTTDR
jgi:peroxiredoxin Q/BCP